LIHVPLLIYNVDVKGIVRKPVSLSAIMWLILELVHEKENPRLLNSFFERENQWAISKLFLKNHWAIAVRSENWKFITGQKNEDELYCLRKDPYEKNNLLEAYPDLAKEFRKIVKIHLNEEHRKERLHNIAKLKYILRNISSRKAFKI